MGLIYNIWSTYVVNILDILVVSFIIYKCLVAIKGTRTIQIVIGLIALFAITIIAKDVVHLRALSWLMNKFWLAAVIILSVVFQSEIRYGLAKLGSKIVFNDIDIKTNFLEEIAEAAIEMSKSKTGALIVIEKSFGLKNYTDTGIMMDAKISHELLLSIFNTKAPVHDGAVIVKNERLHSAGCVLPISTELEVKHLGTRHRAAIGISALTDAIVVVVSEETGRISFCSGGEIETVARDNLLTVLSENYKQKAYLQ